MTEQFLSFYLKNMIFAMNFYKNDGNIGREAN